MRGERSGGRGWDIRDLLTSQHVPHALGEEQERASAEPRSAEDLGQQNGCSRIEIGEGAPHRSVPSIGQSNHKLVRALRSTKSNDGKTLTGQRMVGIDDGDVRHQPVFDGGVTRG